MAKFRKVQHLRSSVQGKYPTLEQVEYGEITVNFYQGDEFLCIRNKGIKGDGSDDAIVSFRTWPYIQKVIEDNELVTAAALTTIKESCGFNKEGEYVPSSASTYISNTNSVTEALEVLDKNLAQTYTKDEIDAKGFLTQVPDEYVTNDEFESHASLVNEKLDGLETSKQNVLKAGSGIEIDKDVIKCILDTTLYLVVSSLPTENIQDNKIYLVKSNTSGDTNVYIEYAYVGNNWEELGKYKSEVNLDPYLTQESASSTYLTKSSAKSEYATLKIVEDNEEVTAAALTVLNESCGFNENAKFTPSTDATYISNTNSVTDALNVLDKNLAQTYTKIDDRFITLETVIEDNEEVTAAALTVLNESCGFNENAKFTPSTDATYISNTNSVTDALNVLDKNLAQTQLTLSKAIDVLDTKVPRAITIEHGDSRWDTPSYSDKTQFLSDKNVAFLRNNYNFELTLPFQHLTTIYYAKYVSKSYFQDTYNYIFLVGEYMVLISATSDSSEITWHPILDRQA